MGRFLDHRRCRGHVAVFHVTDEAVAAPRQSLDVAGFVGRLAQRVAQLLDGAVQAGVEINKSVAGPKLLVQFLACHDLAGMLEQEREHLEGLVLELQPNAVLAQLTRTQVHVKRVESRTAASVGSFHTAVPRLRVVYH